ncbi:hypothetical protein [Dongia sp.]|uniref:hypothetical protein n=1 Tax=Dongia sp. TaxID=1977262 RepID=UPI00375265C4
MLSPFAKNDVMETDKGLHRVLRVLAESNQIVMFDLEIKNAWPRWRSLSEVIDEYKCRDLKLIEDPHREAMRRTELSDADKRIRDKRMSILQPLFEDPRLQILSLRPRAIIAIFFGDECPVSENAITKWLRQYWERGQVPNALIPDLKNCGYPLEPRTVTKKLGRHRGGDPTERTAGINITPDDAAKLRTGAIHIAAGSTWESAFKKTSKLYWGGEQIIDGVAHDWLLPRNQRPTKDQFVYHAGKELKRADKIIGRVGQNAFHLMHRERTGSAKGNAHGPGSIYQIDSTVADVYLRSLIDPNRIVGRPVVYFVVDHYSGMIVGLWVSLRPASVQGCLRALRVALMPKSQFCRYFNIDIEDEDWPADCMFFELLTDRGTDFTNLVVDALVNIWEIRRSMAALRRGDWKGAVETTFNWLNYKVIEEWVPGTTHLRRPGEPSCPDDCVHTIVSFWKLLILAVLDHNNRKLEVLPPGYDLLQNGHPTSREVFQNGFRLEGGRRKPDLVLVDKVLMHTVRGHLSNRGIYVPGGLTYRCKSGIDRDWYVRQPNRTWDDVLVYSGELGLGDARIWLKDKRRFEDLELTPDLQFFSNWSLDEFLDQTKWMEVMDGRKTDEDLKTKFAIEYQMRKITAGAAAELDAAGGVTKAYNLQEDRAKEIAHVESTLDTPACAPAEVTTVPQPDPVASKEGSTSLAAPSHRSALRSLIRTDRGGRNDK